MAFRSFRHMLTALLLFLSLATGAAAVQVRVAPAASTGAVGSIITVIVEADSVTDLGGFQCGFAYSTADLQAISATINPAFDQVVAQNLGSATGTGMIAATVFDNPPVSGTPVTLATIDFKLLTPASSAINLVNVLLGQVGGAEIASGASGGNVTGTAIPAITVIPPTIVNGTCGSSNGSTFSIAPTVNLCTTGTISVVTGTGPWNWSCVGNNGGSTARCSANILQSLVTPTPVITFNPLPDTTYGDAPFDPGAVSSSGRAITYASSNPAVAGTIGNMIGIVGVGSSTITASEAGVTAATAAPDVSRGLTVKPAILFVTAQSTTKSFSSFIPAFNVTYTGFVNGETASVLSGLPSISTTATPFSPVGSYPIVVGQGTLTAANYTFTFVNGTLTVTEMAAGSDGKTMTPIAMEVASGSKVAIGAGTRLADAAGNPVSGPLTLSSTAAISISALPKNAASGQAAGGNSLVALAVSIDLNISANGVSVKSINPPMRINVAIPADFAKPGDTVDYYSFDGTVWVLEGAATVNSDGTVDMKVGHLSIWAVARFKKLPSGKIALNSTTTAVTVADALRALQISVGMINPSANDLAEGDVAPLVNGRPSPNNQINVGDAIVILQKSLGIVSW